MSTNKAKASLRAVPVAAPTGTDAWRRLLKTEVTPTGVRIAGTINNMLVLFGYDPLLANYVAYDELRECSIRRREMDDFMPHEIGSADRGDEWTPIDDTALCAWLDRKYNMKVSPEVVRRASDFAANKARFNPVKDYLSALRWDGKYRLPTWLHDYVGTEKTAYEAAIGTKWMISAVARIYEPGCEVHHVLVLEGKTGKGKTSALKALVGSDWLSSSEIDLRSKDAAQSIKGIWVQNLDELDKHNAAETAKLNAFTTNPVDRYRNSFGERAQNFPRRCVFAATTESSEYLTDPGGGRRWWGVQCGVTRSEIDLDGIARDRDQLWAEAQERYMRKEPWHVTEEGLRTIFRTEQAARAVVHMWHEKFESWLNTEEAERYLLKSGGTITTTDLITVAVGIPIAKGSASEAMSSAHQAAKILRTLGWTRHKGKEGSRPWLYHRPEGV